MAQPVVTVASGGRPVVVSTNGFGMPVDEATNGLGIAVTQVLNFGMPVIYVTGGNPIVSPVLALTSPTTDNTPDFTLTGDLAVNDVTRFQYANNSSFTGATDITHTITAPEDAANAFSFSTGALANGTWYFRARVERPVVGNSAWSNTVTETIVVASGTTWNPSDKHANVVLSNGNLTAADPSSIGDTVWVRSVNPVVTNQKVYFECVADNFGTGGQGFYVGLLSGSHSLQGGPGDTARMFSSTQVDYQSTGVDNGQQIAATPPVVTDVVCIAYDDAAKRFWGRKNGGLWNFSATANPATGVGGFVVAGTGTIYAAWCGFGAGGTTQGTVRFSSSSWSFAAPSGFTQLS
jgi:hypothetical protein